MQSFVDDASRVKVSTSFITIDTRFQPQPPLRIYGGSSPRRVLGSAYIIVPPGACYRVAG
jgi:hypothetical protein